MTGLNNFVGGSWHSRWFQEPIYAFILAQRGVPHLVSGIWSRKVLIWYAPFRLKNMDAWLKTILKRPHMAIFGGSRHFGGFQEPKYTSLLVGKGVPHLAWGQGRVRSYMLNLGGKIWAQGLKQFGKNLINGHFRWFLELGVVPGTKICIRIGPKGCSPSGMRSRKSKIR